MRVAVVTGASSGIGAALCARAPPQRLAHGRPLAQPGAGRRRARAVRRLRPRSRRRRGCARARAPPADRPAREQRRPRGRGRLPRRRSRDDRGADRHELPRLGLVPARVPAGPRGGVAPRERRLGRGPRRGRPLLGLEARSARVLALRRGRARTARSLRPDGEPGLRRDARLPAARPLQAWVPAWS